MTRRARRQLTMLLNVVLATATVAVLFWACRPAAQTGSSRGVGRGGPGMAEAVASVGPLSRYSDIWKRDLSKPIFDPKPAVVQAAPKPKLTIALTGTAVDVNPSFSTAFLRTSSGETKMASVGQTVENAKVLAVEEGRITVEFHSETMTLTVQEER